MKKRKEVEAYILKYIDKLAPGGENKKIYETLFKSMNSKEFEDFMVGLRDGNVKLSIIAPNGSNLLDIDRNMKLAKELNVRLFQRLVKGNNEDDTLIMTPHEYMVVPLPFKRAVQSLIKKISIPEDNHSVDLLTGQVTNKSKGGKLTMPEIQILAGMGLEDSLVELLKYRGGDIQGQKAMEALLSRYGEVSQDVLEQYAGGVVSGKTFKAFLLAMHIKSTL